MLQHSTIYTLYLFTKNRFLPPSSSCLSLLFALSCILIICLNDHTLPPVPLCLCLCSHFAHFNGCVCGVAPLVALAFPIVCVHCTLHPALCLVSLCCMFCLCIFASASPCFCIPPWRCYGHLWLHSCCTRQVSTTRQLRVAKSVKVKSTESDGEV